MTQPVKSKSSICQSESSTKVNRSSSPGFNEEPTFEETVEKGFSEAGTWQPEREYHDVEIASLLPGPQCVAITGRIANFYDETTHGRKPKAAKGCLRIIVKDDTGGLTLRLWYASFEYHLRLGQLVKLWTTHISHVTNRRLAAETAPLFVSIFPERDRYCHFIDQEANDNGTLYKSPLGYFPKQQLSGLITLKEFTRGGYKAHDSKILVCLKSIGAKKAVDNRERGSTTVVNVGVMDKTAETSIKLWGNVVSSVDSWMALNTVLLITNGTCRTGLSVSIALTSGSFIDVDPNLPETSELRTYVQDLGKREHINPPFPKEVFDLQTVLNAPIRPLFTLAQLDQLLLILDLKVSALHSRSILFSNECKKGIHINTNYNDDSCGTPLYGNATSISCGKCQKTVALRINPRVIGNFADETACIKSSKLLWSPNALTQMLGRTAEQLAASSEEVLRYIDARLLFLRVTVVFGWAGDVIEGGAVQGKLIVLAILS